LDRPIKVLLVEDSVADAEIDVLSLQSSGMQVLPRRVETELEFLLALREEPDVILCDHPMTGFDAHRALKILDERGDDVPFLVVAGGIGESAVADLMKAGADDYVRKDHLARLAAVVRRELTEAASRRRTRQTSEKLQKQERAHDSLLQNLPGMVYRARIENDSWSFDFVSEGCRSLTGYGTETLVGDDGFDFGRLLYGDAKTGHYEELRSRLQSEGHFTLEHQILCSNGDVKWVWHRGTAIRDPLGRAEYVEGFLADVTAQKVDQAKLDYLAHHDVLTGLANRTVFDEQFARSLDRVKRHFQNVTLLFIDLDGFKEINDSYGHQSGDTVLRTIAGRIKACSRKGDIVARLGGDEFALVMDDDEKIEDVAMFVPRLLEEIARPLRAQDQEHSVTASIGIAVYPVDGEDVNTLLRNADAAMYAAKQAGRNTFRFFAKKMNERAKSIVVMRDALQKALRRDRFDLHYQPVVRLADRRVIGVEALARWKRAKGKLMTAEHFIPFAADAGVVASIDHWVIRSACRRATEWSEAGIPFGRIACNLSTQTLSDQKIAKFVAACLKEHATDPEWLEFEVTEATLKHDMIATRAALENIADLGVGLTLDDFGAGDASLTYLKRYPIRRLKIDRTFIKGLPWREDDVQLSRAILALAESLRIEVVAEGVENQEQEVFLHHAGCHAAQGNLYCSPMSADALAQLLREGGSLLDPTQVILDETGERTLFLS
jgi:diguanylate cyclase (GGDEF)-like protein/PAS domain S-box-containing protein